MAEPLEPPPRPTSKAVAAALLAVAEGLPFLADVQASEADHDLQRIDIVNGWQLAIWWRDGEMGPLHSATDPAGLQWVYGCARWPAWTAGPESQPLDPIRHLLTDAQRQALRQRLACAVCWPPPEIAPIEAPSMAAIFPADDLTLIPS